MGLAAEHLARKAQRDRSRVSDQFTDTECLWFMRNSYNIGLLQLGSWPKDRSVRMLEACLMVDFHVI